MRSRWLSLVLGLALGAGVATSAQAAEVPGGRSVQELTGRASIGGGVAAGFLTDDTATYVTAVYRDLFGRAPDAGGLAAWEAALTSGTPRAAVANSITASSEFRSGLISDAYDTFLLRGPDATGLTYWLGRMAAGQTIEQIQAGFIASDEYWQRAGGTAQGWVSALYRDVLGRSAAPSEVGYWTNRLATGTARGTVAVGFLFSTEHLTTVVNGYYQRLLGRDLDPSGQVWWVRALQGHNRDEEIIGAVVSSPEYYARCLWYGPRMSTIQVTPLEATITLGQSVTVQVLAYDQYGHFLADATSQAMIILPDWTGCDHGVCTPKTTGEQIINVTVRDPEHPFDALGEQIHVTVLAP